MEALTSTSSRPAPAARAASPLDLAARRVSWLDSRQAVLARNIANADTPNYRPHDLLPFARHLAAALPPDMARTAPAHLPPRGGNRAAAPEDRLVAEAVPDGNAVSLDREAVRMAETDTAHALAMAVHRSFMGMFRLAIGRQG
ncbi:flagellar basal body rod protein FlgB [Falsiroseomonas sp. E2-1-a4]|uniref:flagellar basal body rod protein FlgB n=1 Tax=Falsiroseomonas sp. E2-1-a4 TaxID=3239299 RepID=UPI003F377CCF